MRDFSVRRELREDSLPTFLKTALWKENTRGGNDDGHYVLIMHCVNSGPGALGGFLSN